MRREEIMEDQVWNDPGMGRTNNRNPYTSRYPLDHAWIEELLKLKKRIIHVCACAPHVPDHNELIMEAN
jgi:hypothetical protein